MEYDNGDFGLPCPPWEDYAAAAFDYDHHFININLQPDTFFNGLNEEDDDDDVGAIDHHVICSKEIKGRSKPCTIKHGRGKELRTAIRVLKPTANQLAAAYQLHDKKKNIRDDQPCKKVLTMNKKDTSPDINLDHQPKKNLQVRVLKPTANQLAAVLDDQPCKKVLTTMNKKDTRTGINLDHQPKKKPVLVATKVMKTPPPNYSIQKDDRPKILMKEAAIKKSSTAATSHVDKPKTMEMVLERKKETVAGKNLNNNNIGPKDDQKVLPRDESSMQLKFESAKRKLHDSYQRINDAKKQRTIQVIEFQKPPLPKPKARSSYRAKYPHNKFHKPAAILKH